MPKRSDKLTSSVRSIVAPFLLQCPAECGVVSVTAVELSRDCSHATVYLSALQHPEDALRFFEAKRSDIQRHLGVLRLRRAPRIRFRLDPRTDRGERIDTLLQEK